MNEPAAGGNVRQGMDYGETSDVHQVHSAIQREKREPRAGLEPLSIWLIAVYGLAIFFGGAYLGRFSGNFSGDSLDPSLIPAHKKGPQGPGGEQTAEFSPQTAPSVISRMDWAQQGRVIRPWPDLNM